MLNVVTFRLQQLVRISLRQKEKKGNPAADRNEMSKWPCRIVVQMTSVSFVCLERTLFASLKRNADEHLLLKPGSHLVCECGTVGD
jgi:hypothetical protein